MDWLKEFPQTEFLSLIASGMTEDQAMEEINEPRKIKFGETVLVQLQVKRPAFREALEEAKKRRADVWFSGIVKSIDKPLGKDDVPSEKLKFEQRKYLAAIDNPEKYSEKKSLSLDVNVNIFQEMKDLPASEIKKIMALDPFAIVEGELVGEETEAEDEGSIFE